jgi:hypothetical protein
VENDAINMRNGIIIEKGMGRYANGVVAQLVKSTEKTIKRLRQVYAFF